MYGTFNRVYRVSILNSEVEYIKYNLGNLYENPYLIKHVKVEEMVHIDTL